MKSSFKVLVLVTSAALSVWLSAQTGPAPAASTVQVGTGFDYSRGDYGYSEDTTVVSIPVTLSYERSRWAFRANLPTLWIDGPADVVVVPGNASGGSTRPTTRSASGLGDLLGSVTYRFDPVNEVHYELTARTKFPTANASRGLGTGKADLYTQLDVYRTFGDITPYGTLGYRFLGRSTRYPLESGAYAAGGGLYRVSDRTSVGAGLSWGRRLVAGGEDSKDASVFLVQRLGSRWTLQSYATHGFSNASPTVGVGTALSYRF